MADGSDSVTPSVSSTVTRYDCGFWLPAVPTVGVTLTPVGTDTDGAKLNVVSVQLVAPRRRSSRAA